MEARRYPHPVGHDGVSESISELASDTARLVHLEIELLKQELIELLKRNAIAAGMLAGAGFAAFIFLIFLQVWLIELVSPHWLVATAIATFWLLLAVALALLGRARLKLSGPESSIKSIKEDVEWVKQQIKPAPR
jgi:uncharacterized membrane protein YqjE